MERKQFLKYIDVIELHTRNLDEICYRLKQDMHLWFEFNGVEYSLIKWSDDNEFYGVNGWSPRPYELYWKDAEDVEQFNTLEDVYKFIQERAGK